MFKTFPCLAVKKQMKFSAVHDLFKHNRNNSFHCLTHQNEFVLQNKPTTVVKEVDKAVHPSWATSARSKAPKWVSPRFD